MYWTAHEVLGVVTIYNRVLYAPKAHHESQQLHRRLGIKSIKRTAEWIILRRFDIDLHDQSLLINLQTD
jgi:hypothetical protein